MKIGRNDPCPCGSGKKYKKCCLPKDEARAREQRVNLPTATGGDGTWSHLGTAGSYPITSTRGIEPQVDPTVMTCRQLIDQGYRAMRKNGEVEACRLWWRAWQKLKPFIQEHGATEVEDLDKLLPGDNLIYNWCQDMEAGLHNAMHEAWVYASRRITYAREFIHLLPDSDILIIQNMRRALAESYNFLGDFDRCEEEFRRLVADYPHWAWGYVGWGDIYSSLSPTPGREKDYTLARVIYEAGLAAGTDEQDVLQERLDFLETESKRYAPAALLTTKPPDLANADAWCAAYKKGSSRQKYDLFLAIARQPQSAGFSGELELVEWAIDVFGLLEENNLQELMVELLEALQANWRECYSKAFYYFDPFLINRHLYLEQQDALPSILKRFGADPVASIDSLLPLFSTLLLYEIRDLALEVARQALPAVSSSDKLVSGAEMDFAMALSVDRVERAYTQIHKGDGVDWPALAKEVAPFNIHIDLKIMEEVEALWSGELEVETLQAKWAADFWGGVELSGFGFWAYMREQKGMGFTGSWLIWRQFKGLMLKNRDRNKQDQGTPSFDFRLELLESVVADQLGLRFLGLSNKKLDGVALVWGLPYIYDYLYSQGMIGADLYQRILDIVSEVKELLFEVIASKLWQHAFVQRWAPADSVSESFRRYEAEIFAHSFQRRVPL